MNILKRIGKSGAAFAALAWLTARYVGLVNATARVRTEGLEAPRALVDAGKPFIGAFWHGRMVMMPGMWKRHAPGTAMRMLISHHRDGRFIARIVELLGIGTIAGSSRRGGTQALRAIVRALEAGDYIGITPDGPRGPRMRASLGAVSAARLAGVPIFAASFSARPCKRFKSWDRFMLPLPFARVRIVIKGPITVASDAGPEALEAARRALEDALNDATREADLACGNPPVEPAPAQAEPTPHAKARETERA